MWYFLQIIPCGIYFLVKYNESKMSALVPLINSQDFDDCSF